MDETDTSIFKPASLKSLDDYDEHYRLYKYDTISIRIIGFKMLKVGQHNDQHRWLCQSTICQ